MFLQKKLMKIIKKRELIIERKRSVTIKFGNISGERFCAACGERAQFVTIDEAAIVRQSTARQIFQLVEADLIHFIETENGLLLICFASLSEIADESFLLPEKRGQNEY